jgi:hypothetical protein
MTMTFAFPVESARAISRASVSFSALIVAGVGATAGGAGGKALEKVRVAGTVGISCARVLNKVAANPSTANEVRKIMDRILFLFRREHSRSGCEIDKPISGQKCRKGSNCGTVTQTSP